ncbi:hypothetical protein EV700_2293 [Fluviicoccus keumensis]|uniref:START domain-containing protein n=1 Tax=Fluviicoccus keumensis TaxID=1435465 RepID=A0A4Q7YKZ9_9GAMM|nr:hypothetical protein [Fluviicoccus keumensis]RZU38362.1 hypothetical protein EV700_2293 [Fluviicoccus keumensis]
MLNAPSLLRHLLCVSLLTSGIAWAANEELDELRASDSNEWQQVKNDKYHHIKTWSKREDGKRIRSFKVEAVMDSSLEAIARATFDFENYPRWYFKMKQSKVLKQVSPTEVYFYQVFSAPPGLPDRDVVVHLNIDPYSPRRGYFRLNIAAAPDYLPPQPGLVRMPGFNMTTTYTPLPESKWKLDVEGYIDPGGTAPTWATNYVQRNAPYQVLLGLQRVSSSEEYTQSKKPMSLKYME